MEINNAFMVRQFITLANDSHTSHQSEIIDYDLQVIQKKGKSYENITDIYDEIEDSASECIAKATFNLIGFEMSIVFSTKEYALDFSVIFDKDAEKTEYSLFELTNILSGNDLKRYNNKFLFDENKLKTAFLWLVSGIDTHLAGIKKIAENDKKIQELNENLTADVLLMRRRSAYETTQLNSCYALFCRNDYASSIKKYEKYSSKLTIYESRVFNFIKNQMTAGNLNDFIAVPEEIDSSKAERSNNKKSIFELFAFYISFPIAIALGSLPFIAAYFIYYFFIDYVYIIKPPIEMPIIPGIFAGIFSTLIIRKPILKLLLRKKYTDYMKYQKMKSGKTDKYILSVFGGIIGVACVIFMVLCLRWNVIIKEDGIIDNSKFIFPTGEYISFNNVEALYKTRAFLNSFGNVYPEGAYVIKLSDGRIIDLRSVGDPPENAISYMESKGIALKEVEFVQDIE